MRTLRLATLLTLAGSVGLGSSSSAQFTSYGSGCPGGSGFVPSLSLTSEPYSGAMIELQVQTAPNATVLLAVGLSDTNWMGLPLPFDLSAAGLPGCDLLASPDLLQPLVADATGEASLMFPGGQVGQTLFLQAFALDPSPSTLGGMSAGARIDFVALPPNPVVSTISPKEAVAGEVVTFHGANFGTGPAEQVRLTSESGAFAFQPVTRTDTTITARLLPFADSAPPEKILIATGIGATTTLPDFGGGAVSFGKPAYAHCYDLTDPNASSLSDIEFDPDVPGLGGDMTCEPLSAGYDFIPFEFDSVNGVVCWNPPTNFCDGDQLFAILSFSYTSSEADLGFCEEININLVDPCSPLAANLVAGAVNLAIASAFSSVGIPCVSGVDPFTNKLTILCPGNPILVMGPCSGVYVSRGAGNTSMQTALGGVEDEFAGPNDTASPDAELASLLTAPKDFDSCAIDSHFGHTLTGFGGSNGVKQAFLEIRMRPCGSGSSVENDAINLEVTPGGGPPTFLWGSAIRNLPEAGGTWQQATNSPTTFCLDLSQLPLSGGGTISLLDELCDDSLDIRVQDDTAVDFVRLRVERCGN